ncbi:MAG: PAS domain S-box protein [Methanoregula sp.]
MVELQDLTEMFEKSPLAQAVVDVNLRFLMVNDAFCKLVGYDKDRLLAIKYSDFRAQGMIKYLKDSGESISDAVNSRRVTTGQSTMETSSGVHVIVRGNVPLLNEKGDIKYVYITYSEITKIEKVLDYVGHEIDGLSKVFAEIADCDLTVHYDITKPDEDTKEAYEHIVKIRDGVRTITTNLRNTVVDINKKTNTLASDAENATRSLEEGSKGVQEIAQDATKVSTNAEKASQGVEQIAKAMQDMSAAVEEITSSMESVSNLTKQTNDLSQSGAALAGKAAKGMAEISESSSKV